MKHFKLISLLLFSLLFLTTCKKYPEGGWVALTIKHLFGHNKDGAQKIWKLKTYEVNGIDSTDYIKYPGFPSDFKDSFVRFFVDDTRTESYIAYTSIYGYEIDVHKKEKSICFVSELNSSGIYTKNDSTQCGMIAANKYCERNIFNPIENKTTTWEIRALTKHKLIIESSSIYKYKIILEY